MAKTIFFNIPATGHINPTLPLITELVRRGEEVICVNTEDMRVHTEPTGAAFHPYPDLSDLEALMEQAGGGNIPRNALMLTQIGERILPFVNDLLKTEKPDYVIFDSLCAWAKYAAHQLGILSIASVATLLLPPGEMPPFTTSMLMKTLGQMIPVMPEYWNTARRMRQAHGVSPAGLMSAVMSTGDLNIVYTSAEFQPSANKFGNRYKFVGPSISPRADSGTFPFNQITRRPAVYISLGTINNQNLDFYRTCFAAFADHPGQFVLSVGKKTNISDLGAIPENFIVRNHVPQLDVLQRVDLFVTHGGMNSVQEGLWYGTPLVVIPQQIEQAVVARQVEKQGAGLALGVKPPIGQVSAAELRASVDQVLSDSDNYRRAALRLGNSFRQAGGYKRAADEILAFATHQTLQFAFSG
jgi:MGT family glycosyltransferase